MPQLSARINDKTAPNYVIMRLIRILLYPIRGLFAGFGNGMRLIRAYNDLHRLNNSARRDLGYRRSELDRVLQGHRPRTGSN
jgi:uncharacterized protein YjiS (DUF1127 family)